MASWIDQMTDEQLARENGAGPGQVITRTPAQIAAYRAQQGASAGMTMPMNEFMGQFNIGGTPAGGGGGYAGNRFSTGLSDAEKRLRSLLDNPDSVQQSAAYKFRVGQGQEALQRSMGARGMLNSGNRLAELTKYGQDMASQEYDNQANRLSSLLGNYSTNWNANNSANIQKQVADDRNKISLADVWGNMQRINQVGTPSNQITRSTSGMRFDPNSQWGVF